mmetsp:Transcript_26975/g.86676  ORF Transcript_26975/g.86676 Transcript_26975/m.86676 type:complete len:205 (+) Transcript_26975:530-1144(+)
MHHLAHLPATCALSWSVHFAKPSAPTPQTLKQSHARAPPRPSPRSTIETALGLFGAEGDDDDGGLAKRWPAPSRAVPPPLVAHEDLRETLHTHPCDWRSPVATLRERYPSVDYSLVETNEDTWYVHDHPRETDAQIQARATRFFAHLAERPESRVAVVSHYGWLVNGALAAMGLTEAAHGPDGSTMYKNCELRTFVLEPSTEEK